MAAYIGSRDPRFVAVHRGGLLEDAHHRLLVAWAADCADHVLPLYLDRHPQDNRLILAIEIARSWVHHETSVHRAREAAFAAHAAARSASDKVAGFVARAAGHAAATVHMADHELGAAAYAIRAVRFAAPPSEALAAGQRECQWQRSNLSDVIRDLVLSDEQQRNKKFWAIFSD